MASVNFKKCKTVGEAKAMLRHCDKDERLKHEHSNKDIDKTLTDQNVSYTRLDYQGVCKKYDDRIKQLDATTNKNKRKDRVSMFGLSIPAPEGLTNEQSKDFFFDTVKLLRQRYGADNIVGAYTHYDEVHQYIDGGAVKTSRPHLHAYIVPEINGQLNGKKFSSKAAMQSLNREIDTMAKTKHHVAFLTGKPVRHKSVEQLKELSNEELNKRIELRTSIDKEIAEREEVREKHDFIIQVKEDSIRDLDKIINEKESKIKNFDVNSLTYPEPKRKKNLLGKDTYEVKVEDFDRFVNRVEILEEVAVEGKSAIKELRQEQVKNRQLEAENRELLGKRNSLENVLDRQAKELDRATKARDHYKKCLTAIEKYAKEQNEAKLVSYINKVWTHPAVKVVEKAIQAVRTVSHNDYER